MRRRSAGPTGSGGVRLGTTLLATVFVGGAVFAALSAIAFAAPGAGGLGGQATSGGNGASGGNGGDPASPGAPGADGSFGGGGDGGAAGGALDNPANPDGGAGGASFGDGGGGGGGGGARGASATTLDNGGPLTGGAGGAGGFASNFFATSSGSYTGAGGGGAGGQGALVTGAGDSFNRAGASLQGGGGGGGGLGDIGGGGGGGGSGLQLDAAGSFQNAGTIAGGAGGQGGATIRGSGTSGSGGTGGFGVNAPGGGAFTNTGSVFGGPGGSDGGLGGEGPIPANAGLTLGTAGAGGTGYSAPAGGELINAGRIEGGAGASATGFSGVTAGSYAGPAPTGGAGGAGAIVAGGGENRAGGTLQGGAGGRGGDAGPANVGGAGSAGGAGLQITGARAFTNAGAIAGGGGGGGGDARNDADGTSGGGGSGGIGVVLVPGGAFTNAAGGTIIGGRGGDNGAIANVTDGAPAPGTVQTLGPAGDGGIGFYAPAGGALTNFGRIEGGLGALGGTGGTAVVGADLNFVNAGTITVGAVATTRGDGGPVTAAVPPAAAVTGSAIAFVGGRNSLTLYAASVINGNVVAYSAGDRFILGGAADGSLSVAAIGAQYQGFGVFQKVDPGTWTLTGTTGAVTPWQVLGGTLSIAADANLGAPSGGILLDGGTLAASATLTTARTVTLGAGGGSLQTASGVTLAAGGTIVGAGGLTKLGAGTLTLSGPSGYGGATLVQAGTLAGGAVGALSPTSAFTVAGGATLDLGGFGQTVASLAGAGRVTNAGPQAAALTVSGGASTVFAGVLSDGAAALGLTKVGPGTLTLTGAGTYTGATTVAGGTLALSGAGAISGSGVALATGATFDIAGVTGGGTAVRALTDTAPGQAGTVALGANTLTLTAAAGSFGGTIAGTGGLTLAGGAQTLAGANTYTGLTDVRAGTLSLAAGGALASSVATAAGGVFVNAGAVAGGLSNAGTAGNGGTIAGAVGNAGSFTNTGTVGGLLTNTAGTSTSTGRLDGGATVTGGSLVLGPGSRVSGAVTNGASVTAQGRIDGPVANGAGASFVLSGALTGITGLSNAGTVRLSGNDLAVGTLSGGGGVIENGAAAPATLTVGSGVAGSVLRDGSGGGALGLTKVGPGTLTLTGAGTYTGATTVAGGTLAGGAANALSAASAFTVAAGATLDLGGYAQAIGSLAGAGRVTNGGAAASSLTVGGGGATTAFSGILADGAAPLALTKTGSGTLTLTGANTYSGGTLIAAGTLAIDNPGAAGSGAVAMDENTRLAFLGSGYTFRNAIRFTGIADPTIDSGPGTIALSGTISGPGILEKAGSGTLIVQGDNTYTGSTRISAGILQVEGSIAPSPLTTVAPGAGLSGTGRVGGILAQAGGFVAPGNTAAPYGTLTAQGPVTFEAGSTLATNVGQAEASRLVTAGTATIAQGGVLQITPSASAYTTPVRLPILVTGAGLTGQFTAITYTAPVRGLQPVVVYDANDAYIQFGDLNPNPTAPTRDLTSAIASAQALARDRFGAFVTQRVLGSVLTGFNQQISCGDCVSGFGLAGSYSVGAQGRRALTEELIAIGGFAFAGYDSGKVHVSGAPIFAGLLRYDPAGLGAARPFVDVGGLFAPSQSTTYNRNYVFGNMVGVGVGRTSNVGGSVFGRVGYVARLSPQDEVAAAVEISRGWQSVGGYTESQLVANPYPLVNSGGTDVINIAKLGGQYTHLFGTAIEAQVNLGVAHGFGLVSGLRATVADVPFATPVGNYTWAEYGARVSYRIDQNLALDAFVLGTLGPRPIRDTIHGGASVRYAF